jgi:sporulation protein YlmC with PRC-barrel domain
LEHASLEVLGKTRGDAREAFCIRGLMIVCGAANTEFGWTRWNLREQKDFCGAQFRELKFFQRVRECRIHQPGDPLMRSKLLLGGLLASVMIVPALAQSNPPASTANPPAATATAPAPASVSQSAAWRSSKLIGLNVYNDQNEKLGDISEILLDKSGKVGGIVIGVGGFLGMGQHDIKVDMAKLKFVDEPVRTSATTTTTTTTTTGAANPNRPAATTTTTTRSKWYPDHAILSGVTKDQLKSMPQFKFD